jgi:excisionase family DNA binding protein
MKSRKYLKGWLIMPRGEEFAMLPLMTIPEAAKYIGVGRQVLYRLIEYGELRVVKMKGTALVEKRSLDDYRASGRMA